MNLTEEQIVTIKPRGSEISSFEDATALSEACAEVYNSTQPPLMLHLDLSDIELITSTFFAHLVLILRYCKAHDVLLGATGMSDTVFKLFVLAKLDKMILYGDTLDDLKKWAEEQSKP